MRKQEPTTAPHGTLRRYNAGCSCAKCRRANSVATVPRVLARQEAQRALARKHPDEFRLLYQDACVRRGIEIRPPGRPKKAVAS